MLGHAFEMSKVQGEKWCVQGVPISRMSPTPPHNFEARSEKKRISLIPTLRAYKAPSHRGESHEDCRKFGMGVGWSDHSQMRPELCGYVVSFLSFPFWSKHSSTGVVAAFKYPCFQAG
jgi:hypothetical protein